MFQKKKCYLFAINTQEISQKKAYVDNDQCGFNAGNPWSMNSFQHLAQTQALLRPKLTFFANMLIIPNISWVKKLIKSSAVQNWLDLSGMRSWRGKWSMVHIRAILSLSLINSVMKRGMLSQLESWFPSVSFHRGKAPTLVTYITPFIH